MKILQNNKLNLKKAKESIKKPKIFEKGTDKFWDDEHISKQMLELHLNPNIEAASKSIETINGEVEFISKIADLNSEKRVLDLGCGPGIYSDKFADKGAKVVGIDLSKRSIEYASTTFDKENIKFFNLNYLDMEFKDEFDLVVLIFFDFCALNPDEQDLLLDKIYNSLKPGGFFMFDIMTENYEVKEGTQIEIHESGFWSSKPYIEISNAYLYKAPKTEGLQYTIIDEEGEVRVIRIYHRLFSLNEIKSMLESKGFHIEEVYRNLKGEPLKDKSETFGLIAKKI